MLYCPLIPRNCPCFDFFQINKLNKDIYFSICISLSYMHFPELIYSKLCFHINPVITSFNEVLKLNSTHTHCFLAETFKNIKYLLHEQGKIIMK